MLAYPKPTDLSHVPGLVAAYNMQPSPGGVLVDISGNSVNGTIYDCASDKEGLRFRGIQFSRVFFTQMNLGKTYTIAFRIKPENTSEFPVLANISSSTNYILLDGGTSLNCRVSSGGSALSTISYNSGEWIDIVITRNGIITLQNYANGVKLNTVNLGADDDLVLREIGRRSSAAYGRGVIADLQIYNYAWSEQQAKDYHSEWARRINKKIEFSDYGVGSTI